MPFVQVHVRVCVSHLNCPVPMVSPVNRLLRASRKFSLSFLSSFCKIIHRFVVKVVYRSTGIASRQYLIAKINSKLKTYKMSLYSGAREDKDSLDQISWLER